MLRRNRSDPNATTAVNLIKIQLLERRGEDSELRVRSSDRQVLRVAERLLDLLGERIERMDRHALAALVESIPLTRSAAVNDAEFQQARLNAEARQRFLDTYEVLDAEQVHGLSGSRARNPHATANRWRKDGRVFAITLGNRYYYPAFEFRDGLPRPVIRGIIEVAGPEASGWSLALWFVAPNRWLKREPPVSVLDADPRSALTAMEQDCAPVG